jgi:hypothetical protein
MVKFLRRIVPLLFVSSLVLGACTSKNAETPDPSAIATHAVQTVEARLTQTAMAVPPTQASTPTVSPSPTPFATATIPPIPTSPPSSGGGNEQDTCLKAVLISETVPDGTIVAPGQSFWKTWTIRNAGTCTWDSSYKFVYWQGDLMGGALVYDLPGAARPGETLDIPIQLLAPAKEGSYRGYWKIQAPSGAIFGVGEQNYPLWVDVVVSDNPVYAVTSVDYKIVREPEYGCGQANTWYTYYATITVNGPVTVIYHWHFSNGKPEEEPPDPLVFTEAGSKTVSYVWQIHRGAEHKPRSMWIYVESPNDQEFDSNKIYFNYDCND